MKRLAAALLAVALLGGARGCCSCSRSGTFERRAPEAASPGPAIALAPPVLRVLHWGDAGDANCQQATVSAAIAGAQARAPFDLAFHAGDNLYDCGPEWRGPEAEHCAFGADGNAVVPGYVPPADPSFRRKFEAAQGPLVAAGVPIYLTLGNHDVATWGRCTPAGDPAPVARTKACLEVAHVSPAWRMPARHYVVDRGPARFIVLDTNVVERDYGGFTLDDEVAFLAAASAPCGERACFVVAHHPAAAAGDHREDFNPGFTARMARLVAAGGGLLAGWLAGHDHDLQHLRTAGGLDVFVSGNGARARRRERFEAPVPAGATLLYGTVRWGFATLEVTPSAFAWRAEDATGAPRYCCAAKHAGRWGRCEPVQCR